MAQFQLPYYGKIFFSSPYGSRTVDGVAGWHNGIDLVGLDEKIIRAPCSGTVGVSTMLLKEYDSTLTWQWGNYVRLDCAGDIKIYLCHMDRRLVTAGQRVEAGEPLGIEGCTGYSTGNHVHVEVRRGGAPVDPTPYFGITNRAGVTLTGKTPENWYDAAVAWAQEAGILKGTGNGQLDLDAPCTRAQVVTFLYRFYEKFYGGAK